jgi:hypothetical protein
VKTLTEAYIIGITYHNGAVSMHFGAESRAGKKNVDAALMLSDAKLEIIKLVNNVTLSVQNLNTVSPGKKITFYS